MVVIAVLLLAAVVALTIGAFAFEIDPAAFEIFKESFTVSGGAIFAAGLVTGLLTVAIAVMMRVGIRRATARRREMRDLRVAHARTTALEQEREARDADDEDTRRETLVRPYVGGPDRSDRPGPGESTSSPIESRSRDFGRSAGGQPPSRPGPGGGSGMSFDAGPGSGIAGARRPMW